MAASSTGLLLWVPGGFWGMAAMLMFSGGYLPRQSVGRQCGGLGRFLAGVHQESAARSWHQMKEAAN